MTLLGRDNVTLQHTKVTKREGLLHLHAQPQGDAVGEADQVEHVRQRLATCTRLQQDKPERENVRLTGQMGDERRSRLNMYDSASQPASACRRTERKKSDSDW